MQCFVPGQILVGPGPDSGGLEQILKRLGSEFGQEFEYAYGIADILQANDLRQPETKGMLPFVGRVPQGAEIELSNRISRMPKWEVGAAIPDYLVRPSSVTVEHNAIKSALANIGGVPGADYCGRGTVVGVIDTGLDLTLVPNVNPTNVSKFDALAPLSQASALVDNNGHGTLVTGIISSVVPSARIISVRALDNDGTISSVVAGLYLAHAAGPCDVINLSLSVSCETYICGVCGTPQSIATNNEQLRFFFSTFMNYAPDTVLVAAAGNGGDHLRLPAAFDNVSAVGSFDYDLKNALSSYSHVPHDRFVLAPGGDKNPGGALARPIHTDAGLSPMLAE
jgi:subtilisin family serine protease